MSDRSQEEEHLIAITQRLSEFPHDAEAHVERGRILYYLGRYDEALIAYTQALKYDPEQVAAWNAWRAAHSASAYDLSYLKLRALDLSHIDLSSVDLSHSDLAQCNLTGASLAQATLEATKLERACLNAVDARQCIAPDLNASHADLSAANLYGANLSHANLEGCFLFLPALASYRRALSEAEYSSYETVDLREANLQKARLSKASLDYAFLTRADVREANLSATLLRFANMREANLSQAKLWGADLTGADLTGACLRDADLTQADLREANLAGADLHGANLFQALLDGVDLDGVDLSQTISRSPHQSRGDIQAPLFSSTSPMMPPSISAAEMRPGMLTALYHCQAPGCSNVMKLELVAVGTPHEDDQYQLARAGQDKPASLICDYLPAYTQSWHPAGLNYKRVEYALRQGDVAALYNLDKEYAPFYCWRCHGVYCYYHMRFKEVWDDYYPHPDYWSGTCPYGHPIFVDH